MSYSEDQLDVRTFAISCERCASFVGWRHVALDELRRGIVAHLQNVADPSSRGAAE